MVNAIGMSHVSRHLTLTVCHMTTSSSIKMMADILAVDEALAISQGNGQVDRRGLPQALTANCKNNH